MRRFGMTAMTAMTAVWLGLFGCGGNPLLSSSGTFSCDINNGSGHTCADDSWMGEPVGYQSTLSAACSSGTGGSVVSSCSHAGSVGACQTTMGSGSTSYIQTIWYYSGTAASVMQGCSNGKFIAP